MHISEIKGLKYPDDYIIKFFFKEGFQNKTGKVIEFGCSNGNNLDIFYQYGWDIQGIDISDDSIKNANARFEILKEESRLKNDYVFMKNDMLSFMQSYNKTPNEVLLLPNIIEYLSIEDIHCFFKYSVDRNIIGNDSYIFIRTRTPQDYRYGRGKKIGDKTFIIDADETGEKGCIMSFLNEWDIFTILEKYFIIKNKVILYCRFDNLQNNYIVSNADIIMWFKITIKEYSI